METARETSEVDPDREHAVEEREMTHLVDIVGEVMRPGHCLEVDPIGDVPSHKAHKPWAEGEIALLFEGSRALLERQELVMEEQARHAPTSGNGHALVEPLGLVEQRETALHLGDLHGERGDA